MSRSKTKKVVQFPNQDEIFERIKESQERLVRSLAGALATAPDDPLVKSQLLEAVEKATKLRTKIYGMLGEIPPKISIDSTMLIEETIETKEN